MEFPAVVAVRDLTDELRQRLGNAFHRRRRLEAALHERRHIVLAVGLDVMGELV